MQDLQRTTFMGMICIFLLRMRFHITFQDLGYKPRMRIQIKSLTLFFTKKLLVTEIKEFRDDGNTFAVN
jgi:hypothetical protein